MAKVVGVGPPRPPRAIGVRMNACVPAVVLRRHRAGEVERPAGDVRVNVDAAGEDDHPRGVDGAAALDVGDDAAVVDAEVLDDAVDAVGGVVDFSAGDSKHGIACSCASVYPKLIICGGSHLATSQRLTLGETATACDLRHRPDQPAFWRSPR